MEYAQFAFIYENRAEAQGIEVLTRRKARVYRGECGEIHRKTDDEIARKLEIACKDVRRVFSNTVELANGNLISWQRE